MTVPQEDLLNAAVLDLQHRVRNLQGALVNRDRDLQAAQAARNALIAFHDEYAGPDYHVRPALARILKGWDDAVAGGR